VALLGGGEGGALPRGTGLAGGHPAEITPSSQSASSPATPASRSPCPPRGLAVLEPSLRPMAQQ
jgi:hypothetical protein